MNHIVITSIQEPTEAVKKFASLKGWNLIVVGDSKSPFMVGDFKYLPIEEQRSMSLTYPSKCGENHYARKNIGYLYAMQHGAEIIAESDDDNYPYETWGDVQFGHQAVTVYSGATLFNIYRIFKDGYWPRWFPLEDINVGHAIGIDKGTRNIGVWQFLADNNPDVDAIHRLTTTPKSHVFVRFDPSALAPRTYCPFNSQNTFWSKECFPLMYLPQTVGMRFCDILRGYVAQRIMWEQDLLLGFGPATVYQERNEHDLFKDFLDEIPMYRHVGRVVEILEGITFYAGDFTDMLVTAYRQLALYGIVEESEIIALNAWIEDVKGVI